MATDALLPGSAKSEKQHRLDICVAGRWMYERAYIVASDGNLSVLNYLPRVHALSPAVPANLVTV